MEFLVAFLLPVLPTTRSKHLLRDNTIAEPIETDWLVRSPSTDLIQHFNSVYFLEPPKPAASAHFRSRSENFRTSWPARHAVGISTPAAFVHTLGSSRRAGFIRHGVCRLARRGIRCARLPSNFSSRMRNIEQIFFLSVAQYSDGAAHEGGTHARISTHHPNQVFNRTPFLSDIRQRREGYTHHA